MENFTLEVHTQGILLTGNETLFNSLIGDTLLHNEVITLSTETPDQPAVTPWHESRVKHSVMLILSGTIIAIASLGNLMSMAVMRRPQFKRTSNGTIFFALAVSDVVGAWTATSTIHIWNALFGMDMDKICAVLKYPQFVACFYSQLLIALLTLERYFAVRYPFKLDLVFSQKNTKLCVVILFALSSVINIYSPIIYRTGCLKVFPGDEQVRILSRFLEFAFVVSNCFIVSVLSILIIISLLRSLKDFKTLSAEQVHSQDVGHRFKNTTTMQNGADEKGDFSKGSRCIAVDKCIILKPQGLNPNEGNSFRVSVPCEKREKYCVIGGNSERIRSMNTNNDELQGEFGERNKNGYSYQKSGLQVIRRIQRTRKITVVLLFTSFYYVFSTFPLFLYVFLCSLKRFQCVHDDTLIIIRYLQDSNYAINFFLYIVLAPSFRKELVDLLKEFLCIHLACRNNECSLTPN